MLSTFFIHGRPFRQLLIVASVLALPTWLHAQSGRPAEKKPERRAVPLSTKQWKFHGGDEFPGAKGSAQLGPLMNGRETIKLTYDFGCQTSRLERKPQGKRCGRYVAVTQSLSTSELAAKGENPAVAFELLNPQGNAYSALRVTDSTGQTLQFRVPLRGIENVDGKKWQRFQIGIKESHDHFGGANDGKLHPPIRSISITAGTENERVIRKGGELYIANLNYLSSHEADFNLGPSNPLGPGTVKPSYVGQLLIAPPREMTLDDLDKAKAIGIDTLRIAFHWATIEKDGKYDFSRYERYVKQLKQRNMKAMWILAYGHPEHGGKTPLSEADIEAFRKFSRAAVRALPPEVVHSFEVWNEQNYPPYWPDPDPKAYAKVLEVAIDEVKARSASYPVVSGGLAEVDENYLIGMAETGILKRVDAVGVHPYTKVLPEKYATQYGPLQQLLATYGVTAPMWDTEWGYSSFRDIPAKQYGNGHDPRARARQGVLMLRTVLTQIGLQAPVHTIYSLRDSGDDPTDREKNFGLLEEDGKPKPAYLAMKSLYAVQQGRMYRGFVADAPAGIHALRWDGNKDHVFVVWVDSHGLTGNIKVPEGAVGHDLMGGEKRKVHGALRLTEASGPFFLYVKK